MSLPHTTPGKDGDRTMAVGSTYDGQGFYYSYDQSGQLPPPSGHVDEFKDERRLSAKSAHFSIKEHGESGRRGINPLYFFPILFRSACTASMLCNLLWPFVPAALTVRYLPSINNNHPILVFSLCYVAMIPCANLIGFAGQEFARKVPHVFGILVEITCGSVVEIVLFMVLLKEGQFYVIKAAILGSILATMLLCLGLCFFFGGLRREEQSFSDAISEAGSGLLLTAGVVLAVPTVFRQGLRAVEDKDFPEGQLLSATLNISRVISILLIVSYLVYVFFQIRTHHGIYDAVFESDHQQEDDMEKDKPKKPRARLTMTECIVALVISIALVTILAINLVDKIEAVVESKNSVSDAFMGLILVPLVEKFAEHITAIDEAWNNQTNFALSHVMGATLQTALFNAPLAVIVGWIFHRDMDLNFDVFHLVMLLLAILTVGRFLQDQKSNYLEGSLLVILYVAIAVSAYYYPFTGVHHGPPKATDGGGGGH